MPEPTDAALEYHLRYNHYPPIIDGEDFARLALERVQEGRGHESIETGPGASVPRQAPSADAVVEAWHLDFWLEPEFDEEVSV